MINSPVIKTQIYEGNNFADLTSTPFKDQMNAVCWSRDLKGDFSEIINNIELKEDITVININELNTLQLSEQGQIARNILINDYQNLKEYGASPTLNVIKNYERDDIFPFLPTDVYSFHVDRSPIPTDTFLCTYHGASSDILPNAQSTQKILIPEIRKELQKLFRGSEIEFESFLSEHFFDLHYQAQPKANILSLGKGNLWKLAVDHPDSKSVPCLHRAPIEKEGELRLLLIC